MEFTIRTPERVGGVDVTDEVADAIPAGVDGVATVFVRHTSAGITINEAESRLLGDVESLLKSLVPRGDGYAHDRLDGNADAHLRALLLDSSVSVPVHDGDLGLGTWQSILFFEGDGPRTRTVEVVVTESV